MDGERLGEERRERHVVGGVQGHERHVHTLDHLLGSQRIDPHVVLGDAVRGVAAGIDRAGHRDELRDARREPGIGAERLRDVRERPERDEGAVAVERVQQQPSGTARVRAATHLGQVQHRGVVDRRPPLLGEGVGALERCLAPAGDRRVGLAAEREQPDRVPDAGLQ